MLGRYHKIKYGKFEYFIIQHIISYIISYIVLFHISYYFLYRFVYHDMRVKRYFAPHL